MSLAPKKRSAWREAQAGSTLAKFDFFGVYHFVYGGNPEWVRRRWFMLMAMVVGWLSAVGACVTNSLGYLAQGLAETWVSQYFALVMIVVPGYILGAVWDKKNQMDAGATVTESTETVTDAGPPETTTVTETVETAPTSKPE